MTSHDNVPGARWARRLAGWSRSPRWRPSRRPGGSLGWLAAGVAAAALVFAVAAPERQVTPGAGAIASARDAGSPGGGERGGVAGHPDAAAGWWRSLRQGSDGRVPPDARATALAAVHARRTAALAAATSVLGGGTAGAAAATTQLADRGLRAVGEAPRVRWTPRGPFDIGGRIRALLIHPDHPEVLWAAAATAGVWRSEDAGASWRPLADELAVFEANALALDPAAPDTLYLGTGEGAFWLFMAQPWFVGVYAPGQGVWRSRDGGATWAQLPASAAWRWVNRIVVSASDPQRLYVAGEGGVWRSTDGGETFTLILPAATAWSVVADPGDPQGLRLLATVVDCPAPCADPATPATHRVWRSGDGGDNWVVAHQEPGPARGRLEVAFAPSEPSRVYLLRDRSLTYAGGVAWRRLFRSTDGGVSFAPRQGDLTDPGATSYMAVLWVSPEDPDVLLAGGRLLTRSLDGGRTLDPFEPVDPARFHADQHGLVSPPGAPDTVFVANDGGVYRVDGARDPGVPGDDRWTRLTRGLPVTQVYATCGGAFPPAHSPGRGGARAPEREVARAPERDSVNPAGDGSGLLPANESWLLAGTQDWSSVGIALPTGSETVFDIPARGGATVLRDGSSCVHDPGAGVTFQASAALAQLGRFPAGSFATATGVPAKPPTGRTVCPWRPPLVLDADVPGRLYTACGGLWRTDGAGDEEVLWTRLFTAGEGEQDVSAVAVEPGRPEVVWVGFGDGRLLRSDDAGAATPGWTTIDDNAGVDPLPARWISRLLPAADDPDLLYVAFGGYEDNLWVTRDRGLTFAPLGAGGAEPLPAAPIYDLVAHPVESSWLFAATDVGVFASFDGGASWPAAEAFPLAVAATDLEFLPGTSTLLAATYGRGLWTAELPVPCDSDSLCLAGRFRVDVRWRTAAGQAGRGHPVALGPSTGWFWFFAPSNLEVLVKVVDGCPVNARTWFFAAGLTAVETTLTVADRVSGAVRQYRQPLGVPFQPIQDTASLALCAPAGS